MFPVGLKIYQCRIEKGLTQAGLALACGIPQPNLSNIEKGKQDLTVSTLFRIAAALKIKPAGLIEEETEKGGGERLTRRKIEAIASAVINPQAAVSKEIGDWASLFRKILPETNPKGSSQKINGAWMELKRHFTSQEIRGICQHIEDARQRKQ